MRPINSVFENSIDRKFFILKLEELINLGFKNIEIPWRDDSNWLDLMSHLRSEFPQVNLGSASNLNRKSIDDSLKLNLDFSMMKFWDRNLFSYSKKKKQLLIPGIISLKNLQDAISLECNIVKIYPINDKENALKIYNFNKEVTFIAAGGLSTLDIQKYKLYGYGGIVIGEKCFNENIIDVTVYNWASKNLTQIKFPNL